MKLILVVIFLMLISAVPGFAQEPVPATDSGYLDISRGPAYQIFWGLFGLSDSVETRAPFLNFATSNGTYRSLYLATKEPTAKLSIDQCSPGDFCKVEGYISGNRLIVRNLSSKHDKFENEMEVSRRECQGGRPTLEFLAKNSELDIKTAAKLFQEKYLSEDVRRGVADPDVAQFLARHQWLPLFRCGLIEEVDKKDDVVTLTTKGRQFIVWLKETPGLPFH